MKKFHFIMSIVWLIGLIASFGAVTLILLGNSSFAASLVIICVISAVISLSNAINNWIEYRNLCSQK